MKYPLQKWIFVDIDGTLSNDVIEWIKTKRPEGYRFVLWSSRGEEYAKAVAERYEIVDLFEHIISKPGYIVDDKGWSWVKYTKTIWRLV